MQELLLLEELKATAKSKLRTGTPEERADWVKQAWKIPKEHAKALDFVRDLKAYVVSGGNINPMEDKYLPQIIQDIINRFEE